QSTDIPNTQAGSVLGTPAYMAPEQARGDIDQLDERADVFGLGAILCEILTGQPPYVGESGLDVYRQAVDAELADAMSRLHSCGADLELLSLAKRCLAPDKIDRPRDAIMLTKELTNYLHTVEERLKQAELSAVEARTKASEEAKQRRVTIQLAAAIFLTLLAGLAGSLWQMKRAMEAEELAKYNEITALKERDEKEVQRQKAQKRLEQVEKGTTLLTGMLNGINPRNEEKGGATTVSAAVNWC
ncbi:MAG TPA: protein kinase, partial [Gemmatales bacterium]|nr:protein kinase [Gemmatales bacterium]